MKRILLTGITLASLAFNAQARIRAVHMTDAHVAGGIDSITKIQAISNDAVTLNPKIDAIDQSDPRIKSVIEYVKTNGNGISILFFNTNNLRYVKKVNQLFEDNHIFTDAPQLAKTKNLVDFNLVKIYVIKEAHDDSQA